MRIDHGKFHQFKNGAPEPCNIQCAYFAKLIITSSLLLTIMEENLTLSEMVQNAMGKSVTPSRLKESRTPGFFDRLLGGSKTPGPFYSELRPGECPHYLFRTGTEFSIPKEQDPFSDEHHVYLGESAIVGVVVITNRRSVFFYGGGGKQNQISLEHAELVDIEFNKGIAINTVNLTTTERTVELMVGFHSSYSSELSDAVAYIADQAGIEEETSGFDFESGNIDSIKRALRDQLSNIDGLRDQINISKVVYNAGTGAKIGIKRGKITGLLGLVSFAGLEIYNQLSESDNPDMSVEDLDPEETAEEILKWQEIGKSSDYKGMELASGALGAAISVDKQTSGREVSRVLSNLDFDLVSRQLEDGNQKNAAMQVASEAVEAYSTEISWLSKQERSDGDPS